MNRNGNLKLFSISILPMVLLFLLSIFFLTGCTHTAEPVEEGAPHPALYVNDTIFLDTSEVKQSLPKEWEELGSIQYALSSEQQMDENCENFTANCTSGEVGNRIYASKQEEDKLFLQVDKNNYVLYTKCYPPMIYVCDSLYVREGGYFGDFSEDHLPETWHKIGTIETLIPQTQPMVKENFTGNDGTCMTEGDEIFAKGKESEKVYLKDGWEYIPFIRCNKQ